MRLPSKHKNDTPASWKQHRNLYCLRLEPLERRDLLAVDFPPVSEVAPLGSLIYTTQVSDQISVPGELDEFQIDLDAHQTITAILKPSAGLTGTLDLSGHAADPISVSAISSGPGDPIVIQTQPTLAAGTYTFGVSELGGVGGLYNLQLYLNAHFEEETFSGIVNDTLATAENIDHSFIALPSGERAAVVTSSGFLEVVEDFESGSLDNRWTTFSDDGGRIQVTDAFGASSGNFALLMDKVGSTSVSQNNEAIFTVDLSETNQPILNFDHVAFSDETDLLPLDFVGSVNGDGISISDDGTNWRTIVNAPSGFNWTTYTIDLASAASAAGMSLGANFQIKFQQFDNFSLTTDGRGFDNISIAEATNLLGGIDPDFFEYSLADGQTSTLQSSAPFELLDANGTLLALSSPLGSSQHVIDDFLDQTTNGVADSYFVRVASSAAYRLLVTRGHEFDNGANQGLPNAQSLAPSGHLLGYATSPSTADTIFLDFSSGTVTSGAGGVAFTYEESGMLVEALSPGSNYFLQDGGGISIVEPTSAGVRFSTLTGQLFDLNSVFVDFAGTGGQLISNTGQSIDISSTGTLNVGFDQVSYVDWVFTNTPGTLMRLDNMVVSDPASTVQTGDFYAFHAEVGDSLAVSLQRPMDGTDEPPNDLLPRLEIYDSNGVYLAGETNVLPAVNLSPTSAGTHYARVTGAAGTSGEFFLTVTGNTSTSRLFEVASSTPVDGAFLTSSLVEITIDFDEPLLASTLSADDLTLNGIPAASVFLTGASTAVFGLSAPLPEGTYTASLAAGAVTNLQGTPIESFDATFGVDVSAPRIINSTLQDGDNLAATSTILSLTFDEPLDETKLDTTDILLNGTPVSAIEYDAATGILDITLDNLLPDSNQQLVVRSGPDALTDLAGNALDGEPVFPIPPNQSGDGVPGGDFSLSFTTELGSVPLATPFQRLARWWGRLATIDSDFIRRRLHGGSRRRRRLYRRLHASPASQHACRTRVD